jgi:hypothetical protein
MLFSLPAHPADREVWDTVGPSTERRHSCLEARRLICGNMHIEDVNWPDVQQVVRRECERIVLKTGKRSCEMTYGMVSMTPAEAGTAAVETFWHGHWMGSGRMSNGTMRALLLRRARL